VAFANFGPYGTMMVPLVQGLQAFTATEILLRCYGGCCSNDLITCPGMLVELYLFVCGCRVRTLAAEALCQVGNSTADAP
jgi:hypothetical protein